MSNPIINLRISGTKRRQGGFSPLVNVGVLPGVEGDNMDRVPLVAEKPAYIVKHAADYVLYLLIDRQVKSCDADAPGVLSIAVAISSDLQLANNASPYRLLREIYEKFLSTYMIPVSDGRHSFIDVDNDSEIFRELLSGYSLEKRKTAYIRMNPEGLTGILCVAPADLEEFFKNTQYKEFSAFKDVEVGVACTAQVTHGLTNLQIPLPSAVYDIYVNDVKTGATMQSPSDSYCATSPSTSFYDYESVEFSLGELWEAPSGILEKDGAKIEIDFQRNRINCRLKKVDVIFKFVFEWKNNADDDAQEKIKTAIERGTLQLKFGVTDASKTLSGNYTVKASDLKGQRMTISPTIFESFSLVINSEVKHKERQILTKITINRKPKTLQPLSPNSLPGTRSSVPESVKPGRQPEKDFAEECKTPNKNLLDKKSLAIGFVVGLLLGLAVWWMVDGLFSKDSSSNEPDTEEVQNDSIFGEEVSKNAFLPATEDVESNSAQEKDGTSQVADKGTGVESANRKDGLNVDEIAKKDAAAKAAKEEAAKKKDAKADLIQFISEKPTLGEYRQHSGYKLLSQDERIAIEAFLNAVHDPDSYNLKRTGKDRLKELAQKKYTFTTMDDIKKVQNEIINIIKNYKSKK